MSRHVVIVTSVHDSLFQCPVELAKGDGPRGKRHQRAGVTAAIPSRLPLRGRQQDERRTVGFKAQLVHARAIG